MEVKLGLPLQGLSPNTRNNWRYEAQAKKDYRNEAAKEMIGVLNRISPRPSIPLAGAKVSYVFHQKRAPKYGDGRVCFRDKDNAIAAMKSAQDALADAGIVKNDSQVTLGDVVLLTAKESEGRFVIMTIEEL